MTQEEFEKNAEYVKSRVKSVADFPKPGILFRDISSVCEDPKAFALTMELLAAHYRDRKIDAVLCAEARGFIFGAPLSLMLNCAFVPVRKPGKLPRKTIEEKYDLEYGSAVLQVHEDAVKPGQRVLLLDDLLATGGTMGAMVKLAQKLKAEIDSMAFVIELTGLNGRKMLEDTYRHEVFSLIKFPGH